MAWSEANLAYPISCYHQVFAFDIEAAGNVSDLAIEGSIIANQSQVMCTVVSQGTLIILYGIIEINTYLHSDFRMVSIIIPCVMAPFIVATTVLVSVFMILVYYRSKCLS